MSDANTLLATLAQSAAAVVAIIGGFLVSRLVALSSEREGLRRQRTAAELNLSRIGVEYELAHGQRLELSSRDFEEWVLGDVVKGDFDEDTLLRTHISRGASIDELRPLLKLLVARVEAANRAIHDKLRSGDDDRIDLGDLRRRGLRYAHRDEDVYEEVLYRIKKMELRSPYGGSVASLIASLPPDALNGDPGGASARRLDESIRDEQNLHSRKLAMKMEIARLGDEIGKIGRPVGVTSAIVILAIYSLLGIAAPLVVMVVHPDQLELWLQWTLLGAFLVGLFAVLGYVLWYARTLDDE